MNYINSSPIENIDSSRRNEYSKTENKSSRQLSNIINKLSETALRIITNISFIFNKIVFFRVYSKYENLTIKAELIQINSLSNKGISQENISNLTHSISEIDRIKSLISINERYKHFHERIYRILNVIKSHKSSIEIELQEASNKKWCENVVLEAQDIYRNCIFNEVSLKQIEVYDKSIIEIDNIKEQIGSKNETFYKAISQLVESLKSRKKETELVLEAQDIYHNCISNQAPLQQIEVYDKSIIEIVSIKDRLSNTNEGFYKTVSQLVESLKSRKKEVEFELEIDTMVKNSIEQAKDIRLNGRPHVDDLPDHLTPHLTEIWEDNASNQSEIRKIVREIILLRQEKTNNPHLKTDPNHVLARKIAKARLSIKLGVGLWHTGKGTKGTFFVTSVKGKPLGVFKPSYKQSWLTRAKEFLGLDQKPFLHPGVYAYTCAEKTAYTIFKELKFKYFNMSPVKIIKLIKNERTGAFLVFAKKMKIAGSVANLLNQRKSFSKHERNIFQSFAVFDFLIGNLDRHLDNWMVELDKETIKNICPIDNSNILNKKDHCILNYMAWKNQYAWKKMKIAQHNFTDDLRDFIKENLSSDKIQHLIKTIKNEEDIQEFYLKDEIFPSKKGIENLKRRALVLQEIISGKIKNPAQLGTYWNNEILKEFLSENL